MLRELAEQGFYQEYSNRFGLARGPQRLVANSSTPTLLLRGELYSGDRKDYRREMISAAKSGRIRLTYCFAREPTVAGLEASLFGNGEQAREEQRLQLQEVRALIDDGALDLRWSPRITSPSGIVDPKMAMFHQKDASGLKTISVQVATDHDLRALRAPFIATIERFPRLDSRGLQGLVHEARIRYLSRKATSHTIAAARQLGMEILEADRIEAIVLRALSFGDPAHPESFGDVLRQSLMDGSPSLANAYFLLMQAALEHFAALDHSVDAILAEAPAKAVSGQVVPELFLRTSLPRDCPNGKAVNPTTYPMLLLEAHLAAGGEAIHYAKGFVFFPSWRDLKVKSYGKRFRGLHRQISFSLRRVSLALQVKFEDDLDGRAMRLVSTNFHSDVASALDRLRKAQGEFDQGNLDKAEATLTGLAAYFPAMPMAAVLLVQCWRNLRGSGAKPRPEFMKRVAHILDALAQNHKRGLRAVRRPRFSDDVGVSEVVQDLQAVLVQLQQSQALVESWLYDDKEFVQAKKELSAIMHVFSQLASSASSQDQRTQRAQRLAGSLFGLAIHNRVAGPLAKSKCSLGTAFILIAQLVACRSFSNLAKLEKYVAQTLYFRLKELADPDSSDTDRAQKNDVQRMRNAEGALRQKFEGRLPSDEELRSFLGWSQEQLLKTRDIANTVCHGKHMGDKAKFTE